MKRIGVLGSGPAGFYLSDRLLRRSNNVCINMIEIQPFPYGLIRYGVSPDHPEIKSCINSFEQTAKSPRFSFIGGIRVPGDLELSDLESALDLLAVCSGSPKPRLLNIPGSDNPNCITSDNFIGWINGYPGTKDLNFDFSKMKTVGIIGNGNVALDVARLLLKNPDDLSSTDISSRALIALKKSKIRKIFIFGRRGALSSSFSVKEYRELASLPINIIHDRSHIETEIASLKISNPTISRRNERLIRLIATKSQDCAAIDGHHKSCSFHFNHIPVSIEPKWETKSMTVNFKHHEIDRSFELDALISCIGYENHPFEVNAFGKLPIVKCGWAGTGASGALASTLNSSHSCTEDIMKQIDLSTHGVLEKKSLEHVLKDKCVDYFTWNDWLRLSKIEQFEGYSRSKSAEKILDPRICRSIKRLYV